jgi:hypothetical protein
VQAEGYETVAREVAVPPNGRIREYVELGRLSGAAGPAARPSPPPVRTPPTMPVPAVVATEPVLVTQPPARGSDPAARATPATEGAGATGEDSPPLLTRWWFWTAVAVVAGGAVGAYVLTAPKHLDCPSQRTCY